MNPLNHTIKELNQAFEAFKNANDQRLDALEKKSSDPLATEQVERLNNVLSDLGSVIQKSQTKALGTPHWSVNHERPLAEVKAEESAFANYLKTGCRQAFSALETKRMDVDSPDHGGCFLPHQIEERINNSLDDLCPLRSLAHREVWSWNKGSVYQFPRMSADFEQYWTGAKGKERWEKPGGLGEDDAHGSLTPKVDMVKIPLHSLYYSPQIQSQLLESADFDVVQWLQVVATHCMALSSHESFLYGDGIKKPKGLAHNDYRTTNNDKYKIQVHNTGKDQDFGDDTGYQTLLNVVMNLDAPYMKQAKWLMSNEVLKNIRLLKSPDNGSYLWSPDGQGSGGATSLLMGFPVVLTNGLKKLSEKDIGAFFGDFAQAYTIVDQGPMSLVRDGSMAKPFVEFFMRYTVGAGLTNGSALQALKFAA